MTATEYVFAPLPTSTIGASEPFQVLTSLLGELELELQDQPEGRARVEREASGLNWVKLGTPISLVNQLC